MNKKSTLRSVANDYLTHPRKEEGITLIALIVTIVVLLILAGVSINLVIGDNGLISKSKDTRDKYAQAEANDQSSINGAVDWINEQVGESGVGGGDKILPTSDNTTPYFPSDDFSVVSGTDLDNGLVIQDSQGNQYVWIEVPRTTTVYPTAGLNITEFTGDEYKQIETDLRRYTSFYYQGGNPPYGPYGYVNTDDTNTAKNKMLKSVYENGGFWIGRYEAGFTTSRNSKNDPITNITKPLSKPNLYPINLVTNAQAEELAEKVLENNPNYTSSLMYGEQWDLVLKYIETKEVAKGTELATIQSALSSDSSSWGNYGNAEFSITNRNAKYARIYPSSYGSGADVSWNSIADEFEKTFCGSGGVLTHGILLSTGANQTRNCMQNIFDLAGNVWEWTAGDDYLRGGSLYSYGSYAAATKLHGGTHTIYGSGNTDTPFEDFGFRIAIY